MKHISTREAGDITGVICYDEIDLQTVLNTYTLPPKWRVISQGAHFILAAEEGGVIVTPEYQAILDYATLNGYAKPSAEVQAMQNTLIGAMKDAGIWTELDVFYNFINDAPDGAFAKINWKAPNLYYIAQVGVVPWVQNTGFFGNGNVANYLNTGWAPDANGIKFKAGAASMFHESSDPIASTGVVTGSQNLTKSAILQEYTVQIIYYTLGVLAPGVTTQYPSFFHSRSTGLTLSLNRRGAQIHTISQADNSIAGTPSLYLHGYNNAGVNASPSFGHIGTFGAGSNVIDPATLYSLWDAYATPLKARGAYKKITDYATLNGYALPSAGQQADQLALIQSMMEQDIWNRLDVFYNFITDGDHNFAKINWKNPGVNQALNVNVPLFAANAGFKMNGIDQAINTTWDPSTGSNFRISDAGFFLDYLDAFNPLDLDVHIDGCGNASAQVLVIPYTSTNPDVRINNSPGGRNVPYSVSPGLWQMWRYAGDPTHNYLKIGSGSPAQQTGNPEAALPRPVGNPFNLGALFSNGARSSYGHQRYGCFGAGSGWNVSTFYTAWTAYANKYKALGAYKRITDYATANLYALPSAGQQTVQRQLILDLMNAGLWDKLDIFYNFLTDGSADFAKINWKNPGTFQAIGTGHEPTFIVNKGFKGDAIGQYLNTQWIPKVNGQNFQLTPNCVILDVFGVSPLTNVIIFGADNGTNVDMLWYYPNSVNSYYMADNQSGSNLTNNAPPADHVATMTRQIGYITSIFNGVLGQAAPQAISDRPNNPIALLGLNNGGVVNNFTDNGLGMFGIGEWIGKEVQMNDIWAAYSAPIKAAIVYKAVTDYATSQLWALPSAGVQTLHRQLIADLIKKGVWTALDCFYNFIHDAGENFSRINWRNPGVGNGANAGMTVTPDGIQGDGIADYWDTGFNPFTMGVKQTMVDTGVMISIGNTFPDSFVYGAFDAVNDRYNRLNLSAATIFAQMHNVVIANTGISGAGKGFHHLYNTSPTGGGYIQNGVEVYHNPSAGAPIGAGQPNINYWLACQNIGGAGSNFSTAKIRMFASGYSLKIYGSAFYNAWHTFELANGLS